MVIPGTDGRFPAGIGSYYDQIVREEPLLIGRECHRGVASKVTVAGQRGEGGDQ
jgi:hypothetical protein